MRAHSLRHLDDDTLVGQLRSLVTRERESMASMLAHLGEVERRRLFAPAGYASMHDYCVRLFGWSRQTAFKRIGAARVARRFPGVLAAICEGRLHVSALVLLRPHLDRGNAQDLLAAAEHRSKSEIEALLAERAPRPPVPARITPLGPTPGPEVSRRSELQLSPGIVGRPPSTDAPAGTSTAPARFALQVTIDEETHELLERARDLMSHQNPSRDLALVLHRALKSLVQQLESRKFATSERPRGPRGDAQPGTRHIPAEVRRAVRRRDGDQCTYVAEDGTRCESRARLEFDHGTAVALGGEGTAENIRLLCRTHNRLAAEQTFGVAFMQKKRDEARRERAEARLRAREAKAQSRADAEAREQDPECSVIPWLRRLGFRLDEARRAAARCAHLSDAPMAERVRAALAGSVV